MFMKNLIISEIESGQRLERYLKRVLPAAPTSFIYRMLRQKNITLNGRKAKGNEIVRENDQVAVFFSDETWEKFSKVDDTSAADRVQDRVKSFRDAYRDLSGIEVFYEDRHLLLAWKPSGILTQKAKPEDLSMNEWFVGRLLDTGEITEASLSAFTPSVCNRLDRNTRGLVICAKTQIAGRSIARWLRERSIHKYYAMVVCGRVTRDGTVEGYLCKDSASNTVTFSETDMPGASYSRTVYHPLQTSGSLTLLEAELITGKTHQLRAHMARIGHPVLGDPKYGDRTYNSAYRKYIHDGQLLCCRKVTFPEADGAMAGISGKTFEADLPDDFKAVMGSADVMGRQRKEHGDMEFQRSSRLTSGGRNQPYKRGV